MQNGEGIAGVVSGGGRVMAVMVLVLGLVLVLGCGKSDKPQGTPKLPVSGKDTAKSNDKSDASTGTPVAPAESPDGASKPVKPSDPAADDEPEGPNDGVFARITTPRGEIRIKLEYRLAPLTVTSFVGLAEGTVKHNRGTGPFFDGLTFHRVEDWVVQGGCPEGTGAGGPGYQFRQETTPALKHDRPGVVAMARTMVPGSNGSQFYFALKPVPFLDGQYNVFGIVVEGLDVVRQIQPKDKIEKIVIERIGTRAQAFKATQAELDALMKG